MALVLDTGVIYAALDENDTDHERCAALIAATNETLVIPSPVLVELDYWLRKNATIDVWLAFAADLYSAAYTLWPADASIALAAARCNPGSRTRLWDSSTRPCFAVAWRSANVR